MEGQICMHACVLLSQKLYSFPCACILRLNWDTRKTKANINAPMLASLI